MQVECHMLLAVTRRLNLVPSGRWAIRGVRVSRMGVGKEGGKERWREGRGG